MYVCMYVCMYAGMYVCMYVCMCVCIYVSMCLCMQVCNYEEEEMHEASCGATRNWVREWDEVRWWRKGMAVQKGLRDVQILAVLLILLVSLLTKPSGTVVTMT